MYCFLQQQQQYLLFIVLSWASGMAVLLEDPQSFWSGAKDVSLSGCSSPVFCISRLPLPLSLSSRVMVVVATTGMEIVFYHHQQRQHGLYQDHCQNHVSCQDHYQHHVLPLFPSAHPSPLCISHTSFSSLYCLHTFPLFIHLYVHGDEGMLLAETRSDATVLLSVCNDCHSHCCCRIAFRL